MVLYVGVLDLQSKRQEEFHYTMAFCKIVRFFPKFAKITLHELCSLIKKIALTNAVMDYLANSIFYSRRTASVFSSL